MWHRTKDKVEQLKRHQQRSGSELGSPGFDGRRIEQCSCSERQRPRYRSRAAQCTSRRSSYRECTESKMGSPQVDGSLSWSTS